MITAYGNSFFQICYRIGVWLFLCFIPALSQAKEKICLNMIVKNESRVITRCLDSVKGIIDYWVIVDTGSTDGTQEIIKKHLKDIPGELYERPWRNFGENRTEAFQLAKGKGSYILFMDADDILEFEPGFKLSSLKKDLYLMWRGYKGFSYHKPQLAKGNLPWKWVGVTHEYLDLDCPYTSEFLSKVRYVTGEGGSSRQDPEKFWKNVKLLTEGLKKEPANSRYVFYLAESYKDAGEKAKALEWYQKRVDMGGWDEEVFWSKLQIGHMLRSLGMSEKIVIEAYKMSHAFRPHRPESIYYLVELYNQKGNYEEAYRWIKARDSIPKPKEKDALFNEDWIEEYGLLFQLSICAYYTGHYQEALNACNQLLKLKHLPNEWRKQTEINRTFPITQLAKIKNTQAIQ